MEQNELNIKNKNEKKTGRGVSRLVLVLAVILTAVFTAAVTVAGIALWLRSAAILGVSEMTALIRGEYFYFDDRVGNSEKLTTAALRAIAASLDDPYAAYYTKEEYTRLLQTDAGEYKGLGIVIQVPDETGSLIAAVYGGSTAESAGICPGDILTAANGTATSGLTLEEVTALLFLDGSENELTLLRDGSSYTVKVKADTVIVPATEYEMLTDTIGYLRITGFKGHAADETKQSIASMEEQGMTKLILDLRDNPGGSLNTVLEIADLFLEKDALITSVRSRSGREKEYKCAGDPVFQGKMCVLVNANSASASELLTGALKDHGRAYIIGTQTYGKGIVQTTFSLPATDGHVKFTTDAYYTPAGVCIQGEGITPDEIAELPEEVSQAGIDLLPREKDTQLAAALTYLNRN